MATAISNPASFSSVRSAFNAENLGISTSFKDYRLGGPIVPFTSPFYSIGAATPGDDLKLSQFSGFVVPFTCNLTEGYYDDGSYRKRGLGSSTDVIFPSMGSVSSSTINKIGGGSATLIEFAARSVPFKSSTIDNLLFKVAGNHTGTWWSYINYNSSTFYRTDFVSPTGDYDSGNNETIWSLLGNYLSVFTSSGTVRILTVG
jgi:hypothetical protein